LAIILSLCNLHAIKYYFFTENKNEKNEKETDLFLIK
jgi:hypothetical protein